MKTKALMLIVAILLMANLTVNPLLAANTSLDKMEDTLARGYLEVRKGNPKAAIDCFTEALPLAKRAGSWKGFIDAGNAFMALGRPDKASYAYKFAYNIAASKKDCRGLISMAYVYAGTPERMGGKASARSALNHARKIAFSRKNWHSLLEIVKAYNRFGNQKTAIDVLKEARELVASTKLASVATLFAQQARLLKDADLYKEYMDIAKKSYAFEKEYPPIPSGWKPYGETVAGPKKMPIDTQIAMRQSADEDVISKRRFISEMKEKEKDDFGYYIAYKRYYDYPYQYSGYFDAAYVYGNALPSNQLVNWASFYLSRYQLRDGAYVYVDPNTLDRISRYVDN